MKRRIFSFIITLCMIFSLVPVSGVHVHAEAEVCTHFDSETNSYTWKGEVCKVCGFECKHKVEVTEVKNPQFDLSDMTNPRVNATYITECINCGWKSTNNTYNMTLELVDVTQNATCKDVELSTFRATKPVAAAIGGIWYNGLPLPEFTGVETAPADPDAHVWVDSVCTECEAECDHDKYGDPYGVKYVPSTDAHTHVQICANCEAPLFGGTPVACSDYSYDGFCDKCGLSIYCYGGEATCTEKAKCELCGKEYGQTPVGHDWSNKDGVCSKCEEVCEHNWINGDSICAICGWTCDHADAEIKHVEGTEGYKESAHAEQCPECGYMGYQIKCYVSDSDYDGICNACGTEYVHYHDWSNKDGVCTKCEEVCEHNWTKKDGVCVVCGVECEHDNVKAISNNEGKHGLECQDCGYNYGGMLLNCGDNSGDGLCDSCEFELFHAGGTPTCAEQAICQNCGEPYGETLPHNWVNEENPGYCANGCGAFHAHTEADYVYEHIDGTDGNASKHSWECGVCGYVVSVEWTCSDKDGDFICDKCGYQLHTHDWSNKDGVCAGGCGTECKHPDGHDTISNGEGKHYLECPDCGHNYGGMMMNCTDGNGDGKCDSCEYELFHNWSNKDGVCKNCGEVCEHPVEKWNYISDGEGKHTAECIVCGDNVLYDMYLPCEDRDGDRFCESCGYEVYHLHDWSNKDGVCVTCGENCEHETDYVSDGEGKHTLLCTICDVEYITGKCYSYDDGLCDACEYEIYHYSKTPATCTEGAVCDHCGEAYADALDHDWSNKDGKCARGCGATCEHPNEKAVSNGKGQHMLECPDCGNTYGDLWLNCREGEVAGVCGSCDYEMYHAGGTPTCAEQAICQNCGLPYGETLPHTWTVNVEKSEASFDAETKNFTVAIECACGAAYPMTLIDAGEPTVTQNADCEKPELTTYTCVGYFNGVEYKLVKKDVETASALGHTWTVNVEKSEASFDAETKNFTVAIECACGAAYPMTLIDAGEPTVTQNADCEKPELTTYTCVGYFNGVEYKLVKKDVETAPATGIHNYEVVKSEPATCKYPAYYWYECSVCGAEKNGEDKTGALADHDYVVVKTEPATCEYPAYYWYECSVCGAEKNGEDKTGALADHVNNDGDNKCDVCDEKLFDCDHEGTDTYTESMEATCSAEGYINTYCKDCNELVSEEILEKNDNHFFYNGVCMRCGGLEEEVACDHEGKGTYTFTVEASCSEEGIKEVYCSGCAQLISSEVLAKNDNHVFFNGSCLLCGEAEVKECEHNYEVVKVQEADCQYPAYYWYECTICGEEMNREEGSVGEHKYELVKEQAADCQYPAYYWFECTVCGAEKNYEDKTGTLGEHDYKLVKEQAADCQYPAYYWFECTVCGAEKNYEDKTGTLGEHDYEVVKFEPATCQYPAYYWYECTLCGEEMNREEGEADSAAHNHEAVVTAPTCEDAGYTTYTCACGDTYTADEVAALGHAWNDGEVTTEPTEEAEGVMTYTCGVCGEIKTEAIEKIEHVHNHEAVVTAPTCDEAGYTTYTCACGDTYIADEVAALGHAWNDGEVTTEPTEEAEGVMTYTCGVCGEIKTEAIEKIEHVHNHEAVVTAPTCEDAGYTTYTCACGDTYIADEVAALGHLYTYAIVDGKPVKTCTRENVA